MEEILKALEREGEGRREKQREKIQEEMGKAGEQGASEKRSQENEMSMSRNR